MRRKALRERGDIYVVPVKRKNPAAGSDPEK